MVREPRAGTPHSAYLHASDHVSLGSLLGAQHTGVVSRLQGCLHLSCPIAVLDVDRSSCSSRVLAQVSKVLVAVISHSQVRTLTPPLSPTNNPLCSLVNEPVTILGILGLG